LLLVLTTVGCTDGCTKTPPELTPDAAIAFQSTRVVQALDVVRDAAIAANETVPPMVSTDNTRTVVAWHRSAVVVIQAVPSGWKATVRASIYTLTCEPAASMVQPPPPCTPQLAPSAVTRLSPYVNVLLLVINEVKL
jgi:hypothetical protein